MHGAGAAVLDGRRCPVGNRGISASSPLPEAARGGSPESFCAGGSVFILPPSGFRVGADLSEEARLGGVESVKATVSSP